MICRKCNNKMKEKFRHQEKKIESLAEERIGYECECGNQTVIERVKQLKEG